MDLPSSSDKKVGRRRQIELSAVVDIDGPQIENSSVCRIQQYRCLPTPSYPKTKENPSSET
jgi:hypothetical protein